MKFKLLTGVGLPVGSQHKTDWKQSSAFQQDEAENTAPSSVQTLNCSFPAGEKLQHFLGAGGQKEQLWNKIKQWVPSFAQMQIHTYILYNTSPDATESQPIWPKKYFLVELRCEVGMELQRKLAQF